MSRGRIIFGFYAVLAPLDTAATAAADGGTGYNPFLRTPLRRSDGTSAVTYGDPIRVVCQVETEDDEVRALRMARTGDNDNSEVVLVFHFQVLEDMNLVTDRGRALIKKGDRLLRIEDRDENVLDDYEELDMVVTSASPESYGLSSRRRNLLVVRCNRRDHGA